MANPQHIEWLLQGTDSWNRLRKEIDFIPDFSGININVYFLDAGVVELNEALPLEGTNFSNALFWQTQIQNANLQSADLRHADLRQSNIQHSDLRGAQLKGTNFKGAILDEVNLMSKFRKGSNPRELFYDTRTDVSKAVGLSQRQLETTFGDSGTIISPNHKAPDRWPTANLALEPSHNALLNDLVIASAVDFELSGQTIKATIPQNQALDVARLGLSCDQKISALIENALSISDSVSNKLGEDTRADLASYARHLQNVENANPHRLEFLAKGLRADLVDPITSAGFSQRLMDQLSDFLELHESFLNDCIPLAAKAIATKANTKPTRKISKEEVTDVLERLEGAISLAEQATVSTAQLIGDLRSYDDELNIMQFKVFTPEEHQKLENQVEREAIELATIVSRLYWRARQVVERVRTHAGDIAIGASISGKNGAEMAQAIINYLEPVMRKLGELLTALPPI